MPYAIRIHERCPNCGEDLAKWDPPEDEPAAPAEGLTRTAAARMRLAHEDSPTFDADTVRELVATIDNTIAAWTEYAALAEGLRVAAQAVVDASRPTPDAAGIGSVNMGHLMAAIAALRAALTPEDDR